jgi:hypothetical protein
MDELHTTTLRDLIARFQAGEISALDALIRRTQERLEQFVRRMLGGFPGVRAREQVEDVLQNTLIRLTRALRQEVPPSVADFFGLAALHLRRELLDLARSHARRPTAPWRRIRPTGTTTRPNWIAGPPCTRRPGACRRSCTRSFPTRSITAGRRIRSPNCWESASGRSGVGGSRRACV